MAHPEGSEKARSAGANEAVKAGAPASINSLGQLVNDDLPDVLTIRAQQQLQCTPPCTSLPHVSAAEKGISGVDTFSGIWVQEEV